MPPRILWIAILNFSVSKLAQFANLACEQAHLRKNWGKEKKKGGGGVGRGKLKMSLQG